MTHGRVTVCNDGRAREIETIIEQVKGEKNDGEP